MSELTRTFHKGPHSAIWTVAGPAGAVNLEVINQVGQVGAPDGLYLHSRTAIDDTSVWVGACATVGGDPCWGRQINSGFSLYHTGRVQARADEWILNALVVVYTNHLVLVGGEVR